MFHHLHRVTLALVIAGATVPAIAGAASSRCAGIQRIGAWTVIEPPSHNGRPIIVAAYARDPREGRRLFVTDGLHLFRSVDGGCRWRLVHSVRGADGAPSRTARITSLLVPPHPDARRQVHATLLELQAQQVSVTTAVRPLSSRDGGTTWQLGPVLAAVAGDAKVEVDPPLRIVGAPSDPRRLYAVTNLVLTPAVLHRSDDGGRNWQPLGPPVLAGDPELPPLGVREVAVDPLDPNRLWVLRSGVLLTSADGGATWTPTPTPTASGGHRPWNGLSVLHERGRPANVQAVLSRQHFPAAPSGLWRSVDDGHRFRDLPTAGTRGPFGSLVRLRDGRTVLTTDSYGEPPSGVWLAGPGQASFRSIDTARLAPLGDASVATDGTVAFRRPDLLAVWTPPAAPTPPIRPFGGAPRATADAAAAAPTFTPDPVVLRAMIGETARARVRLHLPPRPRPPDVAVLLDASGSQTGVRDTLAAGIGRLAEGLRARAPDPRVALAVYRGTEERYTRSADLRPPDDEFARTVAQLRIGGGGLEPAYTALHQLVTGSGLPGRTTAPVPPGQQVNFRNRSLRVVVHIVDEPLQPDPDGPDPLTTTSALNAAGVLHLGVQVGDDPVLRAQLDELARRTGALAPAGGVDCNGDGRTDLPHGAPLTCHAGDDLTGAVLALLAALKDKADLRLTAELPDGPDVAVRTATDLTGHDLTGALRARAVLTATCPNEPVDTSGQVQARVPARGQVLATGRLRLICTAPETARPPLAANAGSPVDAPNDGAAAAPPAAPPPVVQVPAPAPAGQAAPGTATGSAPAAGTATQTGLARGPSPAEPSRARSYVDGHTRGQHLAAVPVAGGALAAAAATAHLVATRRRPDALGTVR